MQTNFIAQFALKMSKMNQLAFLGCWLLAAVAPLVSCSDELVDVMQVMQVDEVSDSTKIFAKISPNKMANLSLDLTICLRTKFQFWNERWLFYSDYISFLLYDHKKMIVSVRMVEVVSDFKWNSDHIGSFDLWYSFCITIAKTVNITINGKKLKAINTPNIINNLIQDNSKFEDIYVGLFVGSMTDFNVWNRRISSDEIDLFMSGCNDDITDQPDIVHWSKVNVSENENVITFTVNKSEICNSSEKGLLTAITLSSFQN